MGLFTRERIEAKTLDQVRLMRAAGLLVARTLETLRDHVRPGVTTKELDELAEAHIRDHDGIPSFLGYHGFTGSICASVNDEIVHGIPGPRVLQEGDLLSLDCGAILEGWHGDAAISLVVGGPGAARAEDLALVDATEASMWEGIAALRAGQSLYAVGAAVEDSVAVAARDGRAYGIVQDYVGHGIGREMHMDPHVPNYRVPGKGPTVKVGATVAIEPMLTLGDQANHTLEDDWTVVTDDGERAAHWEHTVAVTPGGLWVLTAVDGGEAGLAGRDAAYAPLD